jgi:small GTP-binding protein
MGLVIMENRLLIRILLIGKAGVGKTCFMLKYTDGIFLEDYTETIAVDYRSKTNLIQGKFAKICIFDPPGNDEFSTLTPAYWHFVDIILLIACFGDPESYDYVISKEKEIFNEAQSKASKVLILNKQDLKNRIEKDPDDFEDKAKLWAESKSIKIFLSSAKENLFISESIDNVVNQFVSDKMSNKKPNSELKEKKGCKCLLF